MPPTCRIPAQNVKVLSRAFQALSRIGDEVLIEFGRSEMIFKALSQNSAAYGTFVFRQDFFVDFRNEAARISHNRDAITRFKVPLRFILPVFKTCNTAEHFLDSCEIEADMPENRLHIRFVKKSRVVHSYSLFIMDGGPLKPRVGKDDMKSHCVASARLLGEILDNFANNVIEITIEFTEQQFFVSNHSMSTSDPSQQSHVRLFFDMNEFDHYEVDSATSLTITLKELKGIVGFMSAGNSVVHTSDFNTMTGIPVKLYFTTAGEPLLIFIESPRQYEASFVISTTDPPADPSQSAHGSGSTVPPGQSANRMPRISDARSHVSGSGQSQVNANGASHNANRQSGLPVSRQSNNPASGPPRVPSQNAKPDPAENEDFHAPLPSFHPQADEPVVPEAVPEVEVQNEGSPVATAGEGSATKRVKLPQVSLWMDDSPRDHNSQVVADEILAYDSDDEPVDDDEFYHNFER